MKEPQTDSNQFISNLRCVYVGLGARFSAIPLARLLREGIHITGILTSSRAFPQLTNHTGNVPETIPLGTGQQQPLTLASLAQLYQIEIQTIHDIHHQSVAAWLRHQAPDLVLVSCFDARIPPHLLQLPRFGWVNLHPSILPAYRGPDPLFWILKGGYREKLGLSLHQMDEQYDSGDVYLQSSVSIQAGQREWELEDRLAEEGGHMMRRFIMLLEGGHPPHPIPLSAQPSNFAVPVAEDYAVSIDWTARHAYQFIAAFAGRGIPFRLQGIDRVILIRDALGYRPASTQPGIIDDITPHEHRITLVGGLVHVQS